MSRVHGYEKSPLNKDEYIGRLMNIGNSMALRAIKRNHKRLERKRRKHFVDVLSTRNKTIKLSFVEEDIYKGIVEVPAKSFVKFIKDKDDSKMTEMAIYKDGNKLGKRRAREFIRLLNVHKDKIVYSPMSQNLMSTKHLITKRTLTQIAVLTNINYISASNVRSGKWYGAARNQYL